MSIVSVQAGQSVLGSYVKNPREGLAELVWNAFDADATDVDISCETNELGGIAALSVADNGVGMTFEHAHRVFSRVGDSDKATRRQSGGGRAVHGRHGLGRYTAFALGSSVQWCTTARSGDTLECTTVTGSGESLERFKLDRVADAPRETGTVVTICNLTDKAIKAFDRTEYLPNALLAEFALHLERYPDFRIKYLGVHIDSKSAELNRKELSVEPEPAESWAGAATLTVIEWDLNNVSRKMFLCDDTGRVCGENQLSVHAPGIECTAYLTWEGFAGDCQLDLIDEVHTPEGRVISAARRVLKGHLEQRSRDRERETVQRWQDEGAWPYQGEPSGPVEAATRDAFQVVALAASRTLDQAKKRQTKALSLRLLKETFENDPESLLPILAEVASLPKDRVDELSEILENTSLTQLIQTGKEVGARMQFLSGLKAVLFEPKIKEKMLERRQLHRILVNETWVFGDEWSLVADDERLTNVLQKFLTFLGDDVELAAGKQVLLEDAKQGIPDLVLGRKLQTSADTYEHLVVELKRPKHKINDDDLSQLRKYASAITNDDTFSQPNVKWNFWLVGNDTTDTDREQLNQANLPRGVVQDSAKYRLIVRPWAELVSDAEHRLKFVQQSLDYNSTRDSGLTYLREKYAEYLPEAALRPRLEDD